MTVIIHINYNQLVFTEFEEENHHMNILQYKDKVHQSWLCAKIAMAMLSALSTLRC